MSDTEYYVDNKRFTAAVIEESKAMRTALEAGEEPPKVSNYVADCIYKVCTKLGTSGKFRYYSFNEDMIGDALVDCVSALKNFNPEKQTRAGKPNAFGYFTTIAWYAFLRRINVEKKNWEKQNRYRNSMTSVDVATHSGFEDDQAASVLNRYVEDHVNYLTKKEPGEEDEE